MLGLPIWEFVIFAAVVVIYLVATITGVLQIAINSKYRHFLSALVGLALVLETVILLLRGIAINAVPLTGLFESMIALTIIFGLIYLFLSITIRRVWFDCVAVWIILLIVLTAGSVASPASQPGSIAATPWAIAHGVAMVLGITSLTFGAASAVLYLLGRNKLKNKKVMHILGRMPDLEKLERMNFYALEAGFLLLTFGMAGGIGMAVINSAVLNISFAGWLTDPKIVLILIIWALLGITLILKRAITLKGKTIAHLTITAFILILFALVGTAVFFGTKHNFISPDTAAASEIEK
jgi:ABC-type uncharacterized transport system permease subunit